MAGGGKRRQRLRLIRWFEPLTNPRGAENYDHARCDEMSCAWCESARYAQPEDEVACWFFLLVRDQVVNLTPMGTKDGDCIIVPRIEAWESVCRLYGIPQRDRVHFIEQAKFLLAVEQGKVSQRREAFVCDPLTLLPPEELSDG